MGACTQAAPWSGEGREGGSCFPEGSCDPGLVCKAGVCKAATTRSDLGTPTDSRPPPDRGQRDGPPTCSLPAPLVDLLPKTTPHDKAALRGAAPGATRVEASLGGKIFGVPVSSDGTFCLLIALPNVPQPVTFNVVSIHEPTACRSPSVKVTTQRVRLEPKNVLAGLHAVATNAKDPLDRLTDGKTSGAHVEFSFWDSTSECDASAVVRFRLKQSALIDRVVVHYAPTSSRYASCWKLFGSTFAVPPPAQGWTKLAEAKKDNEKVKLEIKVGQQLRHLALRLYEDGGHGLYETFLLTEIEAWTSTAPPPFVGCK